MDVEYKTPGMLVDEWITALLKQRAMPSEENTQRVVALNRALNARVGERGADIIDLIEQLKNVLAACWDAQEITNRYRDIDYDTLPMEDLIIIARAGREAQTTNAQRNRLIREIDARLGASGATPLEKTYG